MTGAPHPLLVRAGEAPADSVTRQLLVVAAVEAILDREVVLVGGAAVNVVTGTYLPTDLDLVASVTAADRDRLVAAGFEWAGIGHRHLSFTMPDGEIMLVEFPDSHLDAVLPPVRIEIGDGITVAMISLDDLMMDRLTQATDGTPVTFGAAIDLATAAYASIDWEWLENRSALPELEAIGLPQVLDAVRREAKRKLREGERSGRTRGPTTVEEAPSVRGARAISDMPEDQGPV